MNDLNNYIRKSMQRRNNRPEPDFEGYSAIEMEFILWNVFSKESPIQLQKLTKKDYSEIPLLNQIKYLTKLIAESGELKLTKKGFLQRKIVRDIYAQGFLKDKLIELDNSKIYKELDSQTINLTRNIIEMSRLVKKRHGKLSLTKKGEKIIADDYKLLKKIFTTYTQKFNWAYYDGYKNEDIAQLGFGFSLILLSKYGDKKRRDDFYANKYFKAYPAIFKNNPTNDSISDNDIAKNCYSIRTFDRFLDYFGLINIEKCGKSWPSDKYITKTDLFDKFIKCLPHKERDF